MSVYVKMTALADEARTLSGTTDKKSIDEIIEDVTDANEEITDQSALISQILDAVNNLPEAKGDNCIDVTDITRGESDVIVDEGQVNVTEGYYPSRVVKEIPSVEQATPDITVFSTGQIIAKATQAEGYVYGGTRQKTTQLTTQAAKTVTPTTTNQTAVASGVYTTGAVTVKGDSNLKAENIKKDVTIFGVKGTYEGSGGGGGGSASVETCTVRISCFSPANVSYTTIDDNGNICSASMSGRPFFQLTVVCGTHVSIVGNTTTIGEESGTDLNNAERIVQKNWGGIFKITASAGGTADVNLIAN